MTILYIYGVAKPLIWQLCRINPHCFKNGFFC